VNHPMFAFIKVIIKLAQTSGQLRGAVFRFVKDAIFSLDVNQMRDHWDLFKKLVANSDLLKLADEFLVDSERGLERLQNLFKRMGAEEAETLLLNISTRFGGTGAKKAMNLLGDTLDEATFNALKSAGKLDVIAKGAANAEWTAEVTQKYVDFVAVVSPPLITKLDEFTEIQGSANWIARGGGLADEGIQFEVDTAKVLKDNGEDVIEVNKEIIVAGKPIGEFDVITNLKVVESKTNDWQNLSNAATRAQARRLKAQLQRVVDEANRQGKQAILRTQHPLTPRIQRVIDSFGGAVQVMM
jgi:orotidine-5'-phosphate decarboxylase